MKLLHKEELKGIDSTQSTITKWDELFKKALPNLGFKDSLIQEMYPYEAGIPLKNGGTLPVMDTGRVFYKLSWAEKLAGMLSCFYSTDTWGDWSNVRYFMATVWASQETVFSTFFPDEPIETYRVLCNELVVDPNNRGLPYREQTLESRTAKRLWSKFIMDSDIAIDGTASGLVDDQHKVGYITEEEKTKIANCLQGSFIQDMYAMSCGYTPLIFNKTLENVFDVNFPKDIMLNIMSRISTQAYQKMYGYFEVYLQDYLVISLNPIDKFMCSTKQAFQSCMSISKQNETRGTNSIHAFGLPALFPSPSVYLVFTTPGKHKNMYWEQEEFEKDPADRDKEKAYKYLKMTCRSLTYKGTLSNQVKAYLKKELPLKLLRITEADSDKKKEIKKKLSDLIEKINPNKPRLFIGRQYSAKGEDKVWTVLCEYMLARVGIATSLAYADEVNELIQISRENSWVRPEDGYIGNRGSKEHYLRRGNLCDSKAICFDKYGYIRGIYYDNITWDFIPNIRSSYTCDARSSDLDRENLPSPVKIDGTGNHVITVGCNRYGSNSVSQANIKSELDMFKVMMGVQDYSFINKNVKFCSHCGKLIPNMNPNCLPNRKYICEDCCTELKIKKCEACGELYTPDQAEEHELYNIRELTNPKNYAEIKPHYICTSQLKKCSAPNSSVTICGHCGTVLDPSRHNTYGSLRITAYAEYKGYKVRIKLCPSCMSKAIMCDKCKRLIFLDTLADACLLLPNRRVICPDCIDKIRMKQEKRNKLSSVLKNATVQDYNEEPSDDASVLDEACRAARDSGTQAIGTPQTLIKDVHKQINTYLQVHPDEHLPVLKSSNTPLPEEEQTTAGVTEIEDV